MSLGDINFHVSEEKIKKVGRRSPEHREGFSYSKIESKDGWVDAKKFLPADFDLVRIKTSTRTVSGWHTGSGWDGLKLLPTEEVLYWKRALDLENT